MLVVVIFTIFGETDGGKALLVEGAVVTAPQVTITAEDQLGSKCPKIIVFTHRVNVAGQFARGRIIFAAHGAYAAQVSFTGGRGNAFRKHADPVAVLGRVAGSSVSANNIVIEHALKLPTLLFSHLGE